MAGKALVVAYYTEGYINHAEQLRGALKALRLPHEIDRLPDVGRWKANAHLRPWYLLDKRKKYPKRPLLSLDADCLVHSDPLPYLKKLKCDVAIYSRRDHERWPGTLWLNPTEATDAFLDTWERLNKAKPNARDLFNANAAFRVNPQLKVAPLPVEYCFIFDISRKEFPKAEPVIEHFQASRERKPI